MSLADQARNKSRPFDRGIELLDRVDYRLAETDEERDEIYRLRYRAYLNEEAIEPNREHRITDRFDDMPNSWIFGVYYEGVLTSSIRISVAPPAHPEAPSMAVFPDLLRPPTNPPQTVAHPTQSLPPPP